MKKSSTWIDAYGAEYSADRLTLLKGPQIPDLSEYRIQEGVKIIGEGAFENYTALQSIDIPDSVTKIEEDAFREYTSLQFIDIPDSVTKIGEGAFSCCKALQFVNIPQSIKAIEARTFMGCKSLSDIQLPGSLGCILSAAFLGCVSLTTIDIPENTWFYSEYICRLHITTICPFFYAPLPLLVSCFSICGMFGSERNCDPSRR